MGPRGEGLLYFLYGSPYLHWDTDTRLLGACTLLHGIILICVGESPLNTVSTIKSLNQKVEEPA